jgi:hypothetical protein
MAYTTAISSFCVLVGQCFKLFQDNPQHIGAMLAGSLGGGT